MSTTDHGDISKQIKRYWMIFAALAAGTILTVFVAKQEYGFAVAVVVALLIATVKGSLVASFFMHLAAEKKLVYTVLAFAAVFFVVMMGLFLASNADQQHLKDGHGAFSIVQSPASGHGEEPAEK